MELDPKPKRINKNKTSIFTEFPRTWKMKEYQEAFSYARVIDTKVFTKRDRGIEIENILRKIISPSLWKMFIAIYSDKKNKIIAEITPVKNKNFEDALNKYLILSISCFPLKIGMYLYSPELRPTIEKATNHPVIIKDRVNNP